MSSHLRVSQTVQLLDRLKTAVRDAAAGEERLEQEFRQQSAAVRRAGEAAREEAAADLAERTAEAERVFAAEQARWAGRDKARRERIRRAMQAVTRECREQIDHEEGRRKYESQKGLMETERLRKEGLAANEERLADVQRQLAEQRSQFVELEEAAQRAFRGYPDLAQLLAEPGPVPEFEAGADEYALLDELGRLRLKARADLTRFGGLFVARVFRFLPLWIWVPLIIVGLLAPVPVLNYFGDYAFGYAEALGGIVLLVGLVVVLYYQGRRRAAPLAAVIARDQEIARQWHDACLGMAEARHAREIERLEAEAQNRTRELEQEWQEAVDTAAVAREARPREVAARAAGIEAGWEERHQLRREAVERGHAETTGRVSAAGAAREQQAMAEEGNRLADLEREHEARWAELVADWKARVEPVYDQFEAARSAAAAAFPAWRPELWEDWHPPAGFHNAVPFGRLEVEVTHLGGVLPRDPRLALPGPGEFSVPLVLGYPEQGSMLVETTRGGGEAAVAALNQVMFRLLATSPAGKLNFTLIDPVRLGQSFAGIMHLADYEDNLINHRIWTQTTQIEQRLADLNEHMEKVIQMYLRNEYTTIAEYNAQAGNIAEKYHFVVIADFPANFSETAARRLLHIATSGARCGVYTLIHWDHRQTGLPEVFADELRGSSVCLKANPAGDAWVLAHPFVAGTRVVPEAPPGPDLATRFLQAVGQSSRGANRVEVPFDQVTPPAAEEWTLETTDELRIPIGRSGATKLQYLAVGRGTRQHALLAGKTGSGKSTLLHVIITNLSLWCSPEQVEFYLVDFKKGVEFKAYATWRLPQARVVAIESDREFGLSVLQRVDEELKRRGDLFRRLGVQDVSGYKRAGGDEPMPRALLIIDEFQEFFVEEDRIAQAAAVLLDRIVRQGRAFGIHVVLGSQTLGGAYTLARTTVGQMVIRIALQCNEADAYLIMDENNAAPRLLSRPGEGIYNDMAGMAEGNSPFQAVWLADAEREQCLRRVRARADESPAAYPGPIVFEGNAPADVRDNPLLRGLLRAGRMRPAGPPRIWLGAPNAIKGPTEAGFARRSGSHLLVVGQRDEALLAMFGIALISLAAQHRSGAVRFVFLESTPPDSPGREFIERVVAAVPHEITLARGGDVPRVVEELAAELQTRVEDESAAAAAPPIFVLVQGMQHFRKLRPEEDLSYSLDESAGASPAAQFGKLVSDGAGHGIHLMAGLDTYNNVTRFLGRKGLSEFEMRVLFQMSSNDSASLCDDPKAAALGLHRALLYNEQEGYLETFRPYALPGPDWIDEAGRELARLVS